MRSSTRYHALGVGAALVALIGACSSESVRTPAIARKPDIGLARQDIPAHAYVDPQPVGSYPSSNARINGWIAAGQIDSIRAHAWDVWQSITATVNDSTPT